MRRTRLKQLPEYTPRHHCGAVILAAIVVLLLAAPEAADAAEKRIRRIALITGSDAGGQGRTPLRFANADAKQMMNVLIELGGVKKGDAILLQNADHDKIVRAFNTVQVMLNKAAAPNTKLEFLFYYSGHSNETGLLPGEVPLTYKVLKQSIASMPADVKIGILDSCASGTLVLTKGGTRTAPFLIDSSTDVKGYALITSSSADEMAQEAQTIGGSYFTHYMVSGMRGAADSNRDGRVTLNESYTYAFDETLQKTESTAAGPQHANYDFQLAGSGDLVLTDLRATGASIELATRMTGRVFVRDLNGKLVAEINKPANQPVQLGLPPGKYEVTIDTHNKLHKGFVRISPGQQKRINEQTFKEVTKQATVARGDSKTETTRPSRTVAATFMPEISTNPDNKTDNNFAVNVVGSGYNLRGVEVALGANERQGTVNGLQLALVANAAATLNGVQTAIYNDTTGDILGVQFGLVNRSGGDIRGVQYALINLSRGRIQGVTYGLFNRNFSLQGISYGLVNISKDILYGMQAGLYNNSGDMRGMQAGLLQHVNGHLDGMQAGLVNIANGVRGAQFGLINANKHDQDGMQAGLVNVAHNVDGLQAGLVNIALGEAKGPQLGLINYAGNGRLEPAIWTSDTTHLNIGFKMGNKYTHCILGHGNRFAGVEKLSSWFYGFGGHLDFNPVWFELDAIMHRLYTTKDMSSLERNEMLAKGRLSVGIRLGDQISLFGGVALNNLISQQRGDMAMSNALEFINDDYRGYNYQMSLGFFGGIQWQPQTGKLNRQHLAEN